MCSTNPELEFPVAATEAIHLLGAASTKLRHMSRQADNDRDRLDLFSLALSAFRAANVTGDLISQTQDLDLSVTPTDDPLALIARAHDLLVETTTVADPQQVLTLVLDVGTIRQQLRHYVDRH